MKIGFYNPYFDSLGGGERYVLMLASYWSKNHTVSLFWNDREIINQAEDRFSLDLSRVKAVPNVFNNNSLLFKLFSSSKYDLIFFVSDGSVPFSWATKNILLFQAPFPYISYPFFKRSRYQAIVVYSEFTKTHIDPLVGKEAVVINPPVDIHKLTSGKKERVILSVGRFSSFYAAKKQHVLIDAFSKGFTQGFLKGWELILAGGLLESDRTYYNDLKSSTHGLPIRFLPNCSFSELKNMYGKAMMYWHAAGFEETDPTRMEHFGITTVEAMAAGCVPIVYKAGGQPEIVNHSIDGLLWTTKEELLNFTHEVISRKKYQQSISKNAVIRAKAFSANVFCERFDTLLKTI